MNETKKQIADYLEAHNINFSAQYLCETTRNNNWKCDHWRITFSKVGAKFSTDYYTGLNHRKPVKGSERIAESRFPKNTVGYKWYVDNYVKPVSPCAADVLYSLIQESSAIDTSFEYWCSDYGYDSDSISAFNTYQACCKIAKELRQVFNHEQFETLRGMLEGY